MLKVAFTDYINSAPIYDSMPLESDKSFVFAHPAQVAQYFKHREVSVGQLSLHHYLQHQSSLSLLSNFAIACPYEVSHSVLLFSRCPIEQLDTKQILLTEQSVTAVRLLRLILESRYGVREPHYARRKTMQDYNGQALPEAQLLIGDEALTTALNPAPEWQAEYPYVYDLVSEWQAWQKLPFVFAVFVYHKDAGDELDLLFLERLAQNLDHNKNNLPILAQKLATQHRALTAEQILQYLQGIEYQIGDDETFAIQKFEHLSQDLDKNTLGL